MFYGLLNLLHYVSNLLRLTQPLALCVESLVVADADPEILIWNAVAGERLATTR